jgi:hypothetical protein
MLNMELSLIGEETSTEIIFYEKQIECKSFDI